MKQRTSIVRRAFALFLVLMLLLSLTPSGFASDPLAGFSLQKLPYDDITRCICGHLVVERESSSEHSIQPATGAYWEGHYGHGLDSSIHLIYDASSGRYGLMQAEGVVLNVFYGIQQAVYSEAASMNYEDLPDYCAQGFPLILMESWISSDDNGGDGYSYDTGNYAFTHLDGRSTGFIYRDIYFGFVEGYCAVQSQAGMWGFLGKDLNLHIPAIYQACDIYSLTGTAVKKDGKWGFLDAQGQELLPFLFDGAFSATDGMALVKYQGSWSLISLDKAKAHLQVQVNPAIQVTYQGNALVFDQSPIIEQNRTLVPLRAIFEAMGAEVSWDEANRLVTATRQQNTIQVQVDNRLAFCNGVAVTLDAPAKIVGGRTLVPVRFIAEAFGAEVNWDNNTRTVAITEAEAQSEPAQTQPSNAVLNNGGQVISVAGKTYYWQYTPESFETISMNGSYPDTFGNFTPAFMNEPCAKNQLICQEADGSQHSIFTGYGYGSLYYVDGRLYGELYTEDYEHQIFSLNMQGQDFQNHGYGTILALEESAHKLIIYSNSPEDLITLATMDTFSHEKAYFSSEISFFAYVDGQIYYTTTTPDYAQKHGAMTIGVTDLWGNGRTLAQTPMLYDDDRILFEDYGLVSYIASETVQVFDGFLYFYYGATAGTAFMPQGGNIMRIDPATGDVRVMVAAAEPNFHIYRNATGAQLFYTDEDNISKALHLTTGVSIYAETPPQMKGDPMIDENGRASIYMEDTGASVFLCGIDPATQTISALERVGERVFYTVQTYFRNPAYDIGWREAHQLMRIECYEKPSPQSPPKLLYSFHV